MKWIAPAVVVSCLNRNAQQFFRHDHSTSPGFTALLLAGSATPSSPRVLLVRRDAPRAPGPRDLRRLLRLRRRGHRCRRRGGLLSRRRRGRGLLRLRLLAAPLAHAQRRRRRRVALRGARRRALPAAELRQQLLLSRGKTGIRVSIASARAGDGPATVRQQRSSPEGREGARNQPKRASRGRVRSAACSSSARRHLLRLPGRGTTPSWGCARWARRGGAPPRAGRRPRTARTPHRGPPRRRRRGTPRRQPRRRRRRRPPPSPRTGRRAARRTPPRPPCPPPLHSTAPLISTLRAVNYVAIVHKRCEGFLRLRTGGFLRTRLMHPLISRFDCSGMEYRPEQRLELSQL